MKVEFTVIAFGAEFKAAAEMPFELSDEEIEFLRVTFVRRLQERMQADMEAAFLYGDAAR